MWGLFQYTLGVSSEYGGILSCSVCFLVCFGLLLSFLSGFGYVWFVLSVCKSELGLYKDISVCFEALNRLGQCQWALITSVLHH